MHWLIIRLNINYKSMLEHYTNIRVIRASCEFYPCNIDDKSIVSSSYYEPWDRSRNILHSKANDRKHYNRYDEKETKDKESDASLSFKREHYKKTKPVSLLSSIEDVSTLLAS